MNQNQNEQIITHLSNASYRNGDAIEVNDYAGTFLLDPASQYSDIGTIELFALSLRTSKIKQVCFSVVNGELVVFDVHMTRHILSPGIGAAEQALVSINNKPVWILIDQHITLMTLSDFKASLTVSDVTVYFAKILHHIIAPHTLQDKVVISSSTNSAFITLHNDSDRPTRYQFEIKELLITHVVDKNITVSVCLDTLSCLRDKHRSIKHTTTINSFSIDGAINIVRSMVKLALQPCDGSVANTDINYVPMGLLFATRKHINAIAPQ
jgi:hypothetical protein